MTDELKKEVKVVLKDVDGEHDVFPLCFGTGPETPPAFDEALEDVADKVRIDLQTTRAFRGSHMLAVAFTQPFVYQDGEDVKAAFMPEQRYFMQAQLKEDGNLSFGNGELIALTGGSIDIQAPQGEDQEQTGDITTSINGIDVTLNQVQEPGATAGQLKFDFVLVDEKPVTLPGIIWDMANSTLEAARKHESLEFQQSAIRHIDGIEYAATKLASELSNKAFIEAAYSDGGTNLDVASDAQRKRGIQVWEAVEFGLSPDAGEVVTTQPLDMYDKQVSDALGTLYSHGYDVVTPLQVARFYYGGNPTEKQVEDITASVNKMCVTWAKIDLTQEDLVNELGIDGDGKRLLGTVVNADIVVSEGLNGDIVDSWILRRAPLLHTHAKSTNRLVTLPMEALEAGKSAGDITKERSIVERYLMLRIERMRPTRDTVKTTADGKKRHAKTSGMSNTIRMDTVLKQVGLTDKDYKKASRLREYVLDLLNAWKKSGYIKGYTTLPKDKKKFEKMQIRV